MGKKRVPIGRRKAREEGISMLMELAKLVYARTRLAVRE